MKRNCFFRTRTAFLAVFALVLTAGILTGCDRDANKTAAELYYEGKIADEKQDYEKAREYYLKAIRKGDAKAMNQLGRWYLHGRNGVEKDRVKAMDLLKRSAERGNKEAQDLYEGLLWEESRFNQVLPDAEAGVASAQVFIGTCYKNGFGVEADFEEAKKWYEKAAEQGDIQSQYALASISREIEKNDVKAFEMYKKIAQYPFLEDNTENVDTNGVIVAAQYNLAKCYADGKGVEDDENEAFKWYKKAADSTLKILGSNDKIVSAAQYELWVCYERGWGVYEKQSGSD